MTVPRFLQRAYATLSPKILSILATDGSTNDGNAVEVTGTSTGYVNVAVKSGTVTATITNDGTFAKETGGNLAAILARLAQGTLAASSAVGVALSTEDRTLLSTLGTQTTAAAILAALTALQQPALSTAVTPSDATDLTAFATKGIWIGGPGDLSIELINNSSPTSILAVPAGTFLPGSFKRVMAATTATSIVAFS